MKQIINYRQGILIILLSAITMAGCKYKTADLMPKPKASFTVTPVAGKVNKYLLTSTSTNSFRYDWDKATGGYVKGTPVDTVYFPDKGSYTVKLLAYGQSGMDTASQVINVAADDPAALTPFKILTGNSTKKWKLSPEAGALWIGPSDYSATWWANSLADVATRSCQFNDEYTFTKTGNVFSYDTKGDFWVDDEGGNPHPAGMPAIGCHPLTDIPTQFRAWTDPGPFTFSVVGNQLTVTGTGAHLGLYKAANPPDAAVLTPQPSVTYQIVSLTQTTLVVKIDYGWGTWQFKFTAI
jgi:hypothetical protein